VFKKIPLWLIQVVLFCLTIFTTLIVGTELRSNQSLFFGERENTIGFSDLGLGLSYSFAFLLFLSVHEFGHYFTAVYHKVKATLPFYIPVYIPGVLNIGSLGAVIRLKEPPRSTAQYFDIGIAGPLAGFVAAICILVYGFQTLPPQSSYLLPINPDYIEVFGRVPSEAELSEWIAQGGYFNLLSFEEKQALLEEDEMLLPPAVQDSLARSRYLSPSYKIGTNLLFELLKKTAAKPERIPSHFDLIHYPWLFVGYLSLFFTALNLLPIGQLDGGHVMYGLLGRERAGKLARAVVIVLALIGGIGFLRHDAFAHWGGWLTATLYVAFMTYVMKRLMHGQHWDKVIPVVLMLLAVQVLLGYIFPDTQPSPIWLLYSLLAVRFIGVDHPPAWREHSLDWKRKALGWLAILIFISCFSLHPVEAV
jgi:membrane-associated protease RseP (regulator of RpoE activity)